MAEELLIDKSAIKAVKYIKEYEKYFLEEILDTLYSGTISGNLKKPLITYRLEKIIALRDKLDKLIYWDQHQQRK